ncbi:hypothetical protein [Burkholderia sola]|uniref:hypothetical protein n=1 Tax=Burkholderia sola TaxID=2843302 RepID=UPI001C0A9102|nr:hypothetical protein BCCR75389_01233 [Burkholderia cenocepacia]CAG2266179.1 hypothetical protein BCCR75386_01248 [Burkholderia cenocepacia]CAG2266351.1 hypothetical protein BCCR75388_01249 [Burkholderia cenocepacia]CAG2266556.1 hypothetical protein BCCR75384_01249 [Burkholderia cenocepacia]CAG2266604.1 hypothetical protein BCCR75387_01249 [Burkholderia cenocepacia]
MSKTWAYVGEFGSGRITAWAVSRERSKYGGKPLGRTYWSWHKPGKRKPVKHVQKGGSAFFAYINAGDDAQGGGGESLSHRLFKDAIAGLSTTRLRFGSDSEHEITITHGETEKSIPTSGEPFYADVYLRFTSKSLLSLRWAGEMYIEVCHTHAVPVDKQKELRRLRMPVVEVRLPETFEYSVKDEDTTDALEEAHVNRIRHVLQTGFLAGRVISDRRSVEFLERDVTRLNEAVEDARNRQVDAKREADEALERFRDASNRIAQLEQISVQQNETIRESAGKVEELKGKLTARDDIVNELNKKLTTATANIVASGSTATTTSRWNIRGLVVVNLILVGLCTFFGYRYFVSNQAVAQSTQVPVAPPQLVPPESKSTVSSNKHATRRSTIRRGHKKAPTVDSPAEGSVETDAVSY